LLVNISATILLLLGIEVSPSANLPTIVKEIVDPYPLDNSVIMSLRAEFEAPSVVIVGL
jgi:hypothetical protein